MLEVASSSRFHSGIAFCPLDGHALAVAARQASEIQIWQPDGEQQFQVFVGSDQLDQEVRKSPNSRLLTYYRLA